MEGSCAEVGCGIINGAEGGQVDYHCPIGAGRGSRLPLGTRGTSLILTDWSPNQTPALMALAVLWTLCSIVMIFFCTHDTKSCHQFLSILSHIFMMKIIDDGQCVF